MVGIDGGTLVAVGEGGADGGGDGGACDGRIAGTRGIRQIGWVRSAGGGGG